jgi:uncharacterized membrane protein YbaN (DUF454 family)
LAKRILKNPPKIPRSKLLRSVYIILGSISLLFGIIGIFVPVWPTTVFLLISAWFYIRSSKRYYNWLISNKIFGKMIRNYREFKGITPRSRIYSISILWITIGISFALVTVLWVRIVLVIVLISITWHLFALRTLTEDEIRQLNDEKA